MPREKKKTVEARPLQLRIYTLKYKKSNFRASLPDEHRVELSALGPRRTTILRKWSFDTWDEALAHYEHLVDLLS